MKNRAAITEIIEQWLANVPNNETVVEALRAARIPSAPILTVEEAMNHPHLRERETVRTVHDRVLGDFDVPGLPMRFSNFPGHLELDAPLLGEHNELILSTYLGFTKDQVERLTRDGILHTAPF